LQTIANITFPENRSKLTVLRGFRGIFEAENLLLAKNSFIFAEQKTYYLTFKSK